MKIVLDPELPRLDLSWERDVEPPVIGSEFKSWNERDDLNNPLPRDGRFIVDGHDTPGNRYCSSLRYAIGTAFMQHREITISPDMIWFGLMCEVSKIVESDVEYHRKLFSRSKDRIEVCVPDFDPRSFINAVRHLVPEDVDTFLPSFSTSDERSKSAACAAFAHIVKPYYGISMYTCGIRAVEILGTAEDWNKVLCNWASITNMLSPKHEEFYVTSTNVLKRMISHMNEMPSDSDVAFWKDIYDSKICDPQAYGWSKDLLNNKSGTTEHMALVEYKRDGEKYIQIHGLLSSKLVEDMLVPKFSFLRLKCEK